MYQKRSYGFVPGNLSGLFEDLLQGGWNKIQEEVSAFSVPVNISETDKSYEMQFVVPGIRKEDIKVSVDKNILTVSYDHAEEDKEKSDAKALRHEYKIKSFKRSFTLNEKIDAGNIAAKYNDGILSVDLAKKVEAEKPAKEITIA